MTEWTVEHELAPAEARRRLDRFLDGLQRSPLPAGVKLRQPHAAWDGDRLEFRFRLERGFFGADFAGDITLEEHRLRLRCQLPAALALLVGEDKVKTAVTRNLRELLDPTANADAG